MKLTKGKISKLYNKKRQTLKKHKRLNPSYKKRTFRNKRKVNLARKSLKRFNYKKYKGGKEDGDDNKKLYTPKDINKDEPTNITDIYTKEFPVTTPENDTEPTDTTHDNNQYIEEIPITQPEELPIKDTENETERTDTTSTDNNMTNDTNHDNAEDVEEIPITQPEYLPIKDTVNETEQTDNTPDNTPDNTEDVEEIPITQHEELPIKDIENETEQTHNTTTDNTTTDNTTTDNNMTNDTNPNNSEDVEEIPITQHEELPIKDIENVTEQTDNTLDNSEEHIETIDKEGIEEKPHKSAEENKTKIPKNNELVNSLTNVANYIADVVAEKVSSAKFEEKPQDGFKSVNRAAEIMGTSGGSKFKKTRRFKLTNKNKTRHT
jgi:hypothetical protein